MSIDSTLTLGACADKARLALEPKYGPGEARALTRIMFEELNGYTPVDLVIRKDMPVTSWLERHVTDTVDRLLNNEPIQYIFGRARFHGLELKVTHDTLIPRPETAELVDLIADRSERHPDLRVLDMCTGSGCIAIALSRELPFSMADAADISDKALDVARENARDLHADIRIFHADALHLTPLPSPVYDIVASNPPYIADNERGSMPENVLKHEPHAALFVPDSDPLVFYKAIARFCLSALKPGGILWFEINPLYASELSSFLQKAGYGDVDVQLDSQGRKRFISAVKP